MRAPILPLLLTFFLFLTTLTLAFTKEDHEIFRLRDEVTLDLGPDATFYSFLGVPSSSSVDDIIKAFRKKSRAIHPDKARHNFIASRSTPTPKKPGEKKKGVHVSKGPSQREIDRFVKEASARYTRLGVVRDVLKDYTARERYDHYLKQGFPSWRGSGYYYERFRPGLGTVLVGLFVVLGGGVHYAILKMNYNSQREFMDRYIRFARKTAWGDESGVMGVPGITSPAEVPAIEEVDEMKGLNRKQRREMEKQSKKGKNGKPEAVKPEPVATPTGEKRRVRAENGKVLLVDSIGSVFLEEEDEEGETVELLLDLSEIHKPTLKDTAVFRVPVWLYRRAFDPFLKGTEPVPSDEVPSNQMAEDLRLEVNVPDMSSSQISDNGFQMVDKSSVEEDKNVGVAKKRKGKKR